MDDLFEWDPKKAVMNRKKHGVSFPDATPVFSDPNALTIDLQDADGEERHVTLGMDDVGRILTVVHTYRGPRTRIISARKATSHERRQYEGR